MPPTHTLLNPPVQTVHCTDREVVACSKLAWHGACVHVGSRDLATYHVLQCSVTFDGRRPSTSRRRSLYYLSTPLVCSRELMLEADGEVTRPLPRPCKVRSAFSVGTLHTWIEGLDPCCPERRAARSRSLRGEGRRADDTAPTPALAAWRRGTCDGHRRGLGRLVTLAFGARVAEQAASSGRSLTPGCST